MTDAFVDVLTDAATDDSLRAIHILGAGDDFCAGADWVATNSRQPSAHRRPGASHPAHRQPHHRTRPQHPSARGLQRPGLGRRPRLQSGSGRRFHRRRATTRCSGSRSSPAASAPIPAPRGCSPGWSALARAKEMLLLGEKVSATDAADWGLIHRWVNADELRRRRRAAGDTPGLRADRGHRTRQASHPPRPARHAHPGDDTGTLQRGTVLSDNRFQRRPRGISGEAPAGIQWPMTRIGTTHVC